MPTASVNEIQLYYELFGEGDPVLLLTGLAGIGKGWGPQIPLFARHYRTIIPDHRGTGRSSWPTTGYTIQQHASDMAELLRALSSSPAHIVGSSTGGAIAQVMALDHPDIVRSIVLCSSLARADAYYRQQFELRRILLRDSGLEASMKYAALFLFSPRYIREHPDQIEAWCHGAAAAPADLNITYQRIDMIIAHDQLDRLHAIRKPTLVVVGNEDFCTPPHFSRELAENIPGAELEILPSGHLIHLEQPELFFDRVRRFLEKH